MGNWKSVVLFGEGSVIFSLSLYMQNFNWTEVLPAFRSPLRMASEGFKWDYVEWKRGSKLNANVNLVVSFDTYPASHRLIYS